MTVTLYYNSSERNKLTKTLSNNLPLSGTLRSESSIVNPSIMVEMPNPCTYNYAYITEFGRYYYITDITAIRQGLWQIDMAVDVLMSFKNQIKNLKAIIKNTEDTGKNFYLEDESWVAMTKSKTDILTFSSGLLDSGEYILITAGGIAT